MPFQSQSQWRKFGEMLSTGEITQTQFDEFAHSTPGGYDSLPERKQKPATTGTRSTPKPAARSRRGTVGKVKVVGSIRTTRHRGRGLR